MKRKRAEPLEGVYAQIPRRLKAKVDQHKKDHGMTTKGLVIQALETLLNGGPPDPAKRKGKNHQIQT